MAGKVFGLLCILSVVGGLLLGNASEVGEAVLSGASSAVTLILELGGMICLWSGILQVLTDAGAIRLLSRLLHPFLSFFFPEAAAHGDGLEEISANIGANLLGVGNAATPMALSAMEKLQVHNPHPETASADQITLAVLNTASFTLLPVSLLALRASAGSQAPYRVLLPVWIVSVTAALLALLLCRTLGHSGRKTRIRRPKAGARRNKW